MKKHLAVVCGVYYPEPSPTGKCTGQYISLLEENFDISVIFVESQNAPADGLHIGSQTLYGLCGHRLEMEYSADNCVVTKVAKGIGYAERFLFLTGNMEWFQKRAYVTLERIHKARQIDVVFSICSPFAGHIAAKKFKKKHPDIRFVTYTVDPFVPPFKSFSLRAKKAKRSVYNSADYNFFSEEIVSAKDVFLSSLEKPLSVLPYMLPKREIDATYTADFDTSKINFVYMGRFYEELRNPYFALETFLAMELENAVLHIYGGKGCESIVSDAIRRSNGRIVLHEPVPQALVQSIYSQTDFTINVGNTLTEYKPSKVFEYIVSGKPIINFYHKKLIDDLLLQHPMCLQLSDDTSICSAAAQMTTFCKQKVKASISLEMINEKYAKHTPAQIQKYLLQGMENHHDK